MRFVLAFVFLFVSGVANAGGLRFQAGQDSFEITASEIACVRQVMHDGRVAIQLDLSAGAAALLATLTKKHLYKKLRIFKAGKPIQAAVIMGVINDGKLLIDGGFGLIEAQTIVRELGGPRGRC